MCLLVLPERGWSLRVAPDLLCLLVLLLLLFSKPFMYSDLVSLSAYLPKGLPLFRSSRTLDSFIYMARDLISEPSDASLFLTECHTQEQTLFILTSLLTRHTSFHEACNFHKLQSL